MRSNNSLVKTILILAANPKGTSSLRLDEEVREISESLQRSLNRDQFALKQRWAVRPKDIERAMLEVNPRIIHFSGHGSGEDGLVVADETGRITMISAEALSNLFRLKAANVECVVLNACFSEIQAEAIAQHIPFVIGTSQAIGDQAALEFSRGFYDALGSGCEIELAYEWGCNSIRMTGSQEHSVLKLKKNSKLGTQNFSSHSSHLTSWEYNQLQKEWDGLQRQRTLLSERIQRLREALFIETDVSICFKYEKLIQRDEGDLDLLNRQIETMNNKLQ